MSEIFISYSWGIPEHETRVLSLVNHLREKGFNASLDKVMSQEETAIDFTKMMIKEMHSHNKVIVVLSEGYKEKADKFSGGVGKEYQLLMNDIDDNPKKYVLVSFGGIDKGIIPYGLNGRQVVDLDSTMGLEELYRKLTDEGKYNLVPVAESKPQLSPMPIPEFIVIDEKGSIEISDLKVTIGSKSRSSGLYIRVNFKVEAEFKNNSTRTVDGLDFELRAHRFLDPEYHKSIVDGDEVVYTGALPGKFYAQQTKRTPSFQLQLHAGNIGNVLETNFRLTIYSELGTIQREFPFADYVKLKEGGLDWNEPVPVNRDMFGY